MMEFIKRAVKDPGKELFGSRKRIFFATMSPLVVFVVLAALFDAESGPSSNIDSSSSSSESSVAVVAENSGCFEDAAGAKIHLRVALQNMGSEPVDVDMTPWRRYSDNSVNDSLMDELTAEAVPPGETKLYKAEFGYNAEEHTLIECGVKVDGELTKFFVG